MKTHRILFFIFLIQCGQGANAKSPQTKAGYFSDDSFYVLKGKTLKGLINPGAEKIIAYPQRGKAPKKTSVQDTDKLKDQKRRLAGKNKPPIMKPLGGWSFSLGLGSELDTVKLKDGALYEGVLKNKNSFGVTIELSYQKERESIHFKTSFEDLTFSKGKLSSLQNENVNRSSYELSLKESFHDYFSLSLGAGSSDMISFISTGAGSLKVVSGPRSYLSVSTGTKFIFLFPWDVNFESKILETKDLESLKFGVGYDLSLSLKTSVKLSSGADVFFKIKYGHRDEAAKIFSQKTNYVYLGLGFSLGAQAERSEND